MDTSQNVVVYTCITGRRDRPKRIGHRNEGFLYVLFSDDELGPSEWEVRPLVWHNACPVRTARYHKHHPHLLFPGSLSVWLDATHWPYSDLRPMIAALGEKSLGVMKHHCRDSVAAEATACVESGLDDPEIIQSQLSRYASEGFSDNLGLYETSCLVRQDTPELRNLQTLWWHEITVGSCRDQLSFTYCLWKTNTSVAVLSGFCRYGRNDFLKMMPHRKNPGLIFLM